MFVTEGGFVWTTPRLTRIEDLPLLLVGRPQDIVLTKTSFGTRVFVYRFS